MNTAFLEKAQALRPALHETVVRPVSGATAQRLSEAAAEAQTGDAWRGTPLHAGDCLCLDFGTHLVGRLTLELGYTGSHPDAPAWIELQFAERPQEFFEDVSRYTGWISKGWIQQERLHVDVLPARLALPRRYAFRYVKLKVLDVSSKYSLTLKDCVCRETTSADDSALAPLETQDEALRRTDAVSCRTLRGCMQEVFEDGPKRDRRLWLGDLRLQALSNYATYRNFDLVKRCLYLFAGTADAQGRVAACLFTEPEVEADDTYLLDYSLLFIPTLQDYWKASGDEQTLHELWETALRQAELAREEFGADGLLRESARCFVDWNLELNKQTSGQGIYIYALQALSELADVLNQPQLADALRAEAEEKCQAARARLFDRERQLFVSGETQQLSWASQVWMVLAGAVDTAQGRALLKRISQAPQAEKMVTPYLHHYYVEALLKLGERDRAMQVLRSYWGGMLAQGADTFWELYDPQNPDASPYGGTIVNSYCHAWSCTPAYFLREYFGRP